MLRHMMVLLLLLELILISMVTCSSMISQRDLFIVRQVANDVHSFGIDSGVSWHVIGTLTTTCITLFSKLCSGFVLHVRKRRGATCSLSTDTTEQLLRVTAKVE